MWPCRLVRQAWRATTTTTNLMQPVRSPPLGFGSGPPLAPSVVRACVADVGDEQAAHRSSLPITTPNVTSGGACDPSTPRPSSFRRVLPVDYWSATLRKWIHANCLHIRQDGAYVLDRKQVAPAVQVRPRKNSRECDGTEGELRCVRPRIPPRSERQPAASEVASSATLDGNSST